MGKGEKSLGVLFAGVEEGREITVQAPRCLSFGFVKLFPNSCRVSGHAYWTLAFLESLARLPLSRIYSKRRSARNGVAFPKRARRRFVCYRFEDFARSADSTTC